MKKKYIFTLSTNKVGSEQSEIMDFEFDDDASQYEIEDEVNNAYSEWMSENNYGGYSEIE